MQKILALLGVAATATARPSELFVKTLTDNINRDIENMYEVDDEPVSLIDASGLPYQYDVKTGICSYTAGTQGYDLKKFDDLFRDEDNKKPADFSNSYGKFIGKICQPDFAIEQMT